jgi:hypothetical protein
MKRLAPYNQHPVLFAEKFILLPIHLQCTMVYKAIDGTLIGVMSHHHNTIKWLKSEESLFNMFEKNSDKLEGGWSCVGCAVDFEENFGNTHVQMVGTSNKYEFV